MGIFRLRPPPSRTPPSCPLCMAVGQTDQFSPIGPLGWRDSVVGWQVEHPQLASCSVADPTVQSNLPCQGVKMRAWQVRHSTGQSSLPPSLPVSDWLGICPHPKTVFGDHSFLEDGGALSFQGSLPCHENHSSPSLL